MYVTNLQLSERPGPRELAQVATAEDVAVVPDDLMLATLLGSDRTGWNAEETKNADDALSRIHDAVADADGLIDGYLRKRGYVLPLSPVPKIVSVWSRDITRYFLHNDRISGSDDPIVRGYKDALKQLQMLAEGKFSLGAGDLLASTGVGEPQIKCGSTTFRDALKDF